MAVIKSGQYTIKFAILDDEVKGLVSVSDIEWAAVGATAGDAAILTAANGEVVFHGIAQNINWGERKPHINKTYTGLKVTTLDHGILYVHLRRKG